MNIKKCELCPRKCGVDRTEKCGFCGETDKIRIANFQLHFWEEPVISGKNGSGTVFFSGCVLKCVFCQNYEISAQNKGYEVSVDRLSEIFLELQENFIPILGISIKENGEVSIVCFYTALLRTQPDTIDA